MSDAVQGQAAPNSGSSEFNAMAFLVKQMISRVNVATMVEVLAVTNAGGIAPIGTVDVQILVNQVDGAGKAVPHVTVFGLPYMRVQGGVNAIVLDPQVGDIGMAVFAHSDISAVKSSGGAANPGSGRRNSIADGMYCFSLLSQVPAQYIRFDGAGIDVLSPGTITINATGGDVDVTASGNVNVTAGAEAHIVAPTCVVDATTCGINATTCTVTAPTTTVNGHLTVNGPTTLNGPISQGSGAGGTAASLIGPLSVTNEVTGAGKQLSTHEHSGVTTGGGNTGPPI